MLPKLIHQTAKTAEIPEKWHAFQKKVQTLHPDWTYHLWTDEDNQAFVRREYPDFVQVFNGLPKNIMRADVIRYLLMYRLGGMYLDLDYEMLRPFDLVNHDLVIPWEKSDEDEGEKQLGNAFFVSVPGHPFWKMAIDDLAAHPPTNSDIVENETGPGFLTRILKKATDAGITVHSPPREWFNPRSPRGPKEYQALVRQKDVYGIHHCHGSWREWSLMTRMKMRVGGLYHQLFN